MKQKRKAYKNIIFALIALALILGIVSADLFHNVSVAEAKQNTFHGMTGYQSAGGLNVLEITPTANDKDLGYFFYQDSAKNQDQIPNVSDLTNGNILMKKIDGYTESMLQQQIEAEAKNYAVQEATAYARAQFADECAAWLADKPWANADNFFSWGMDQTTRQQYDNIYNTKYQEVYTSKYTELCTNAGIDPDAVYAKDMDLQHALMLRKYGMIKPLGLDAVLNKKDRNIALSEYPIFIDNDFAIFTNVTLIGGYTEVQIPSGTIRKGHYIFNTGNTGAYQLDTQNYTIGTGNTVTDAVDQNGDPVSLVLKDTVIYKKTSVSANGISDNSTPYYSYTESYEQAANGLPLGVTYVTSGGNLDFVFLENMPDLYWGYAAEKLFYYSNDRKYRLGNWIKEYILGDATKNYNVTYTNATLDDVNNGRCSLDNYDLVYISGTAAEYDAVGDFTPDFIRQIYNATVINHKAVMMDHALYDANNMSNIDKLALLLWQDDQTAIAKNFQKYFSYDENGDIAGIDDIAGLLSDAAVMNELQTTKLGGYNGNFAVNNVYVYNHHWNDFQNSKLEQFQNDALDVFANGDLNSAYNASAVAGGFQSVVAYISYNNTKPNDDGNGNMVEGYVTPAIAIQYILSYAGEDLALSKGSFSVLEIEPTKEFRFNSTLKTKDYTLESAAVKANRNDFIKRCLNPDIVDNNNQDYVTFTSITIDQFNTMQTDLVHDYDIVYIGDEFAEYFYTKDNIDTATISGNAFSIEKGTITAFNDANMYGNVYYNYGDQLSAQTVGGTIEKYASRDLTKAKLTELEEYLQDGGLIITDEDLMASISAGNTVINPTSAINSGSAYFDHGRIDTSSNMYELFNFAIGRSFDGTQSMGNRYQSGGVDENNNPVGRYSNFVSLADIGTYVSKEDLLIYLNRERVSLRVTEEPVKYVYNAGATPSYIQADSKDGKYYLECEFIIDNSTAIVAAADVYQIHFYQDVNADGRFGDNEEKIDFEISQVADDIVVSQVKGEDGITQYNLNNGVAYRLRREIPSDEGGIINWCIKVEKIANKDINCTASGFTAMRPREAKYLNILQIIPDGASATIDLETILKEQNSELYNLLTDPAVAQNYVIEVRTITASQFQRDTEVSYVRLAQTESDEEAIWQKYFSTFQRTDTAIYDKDTDVENDKDKPMNVNMVILGFGTAEPQFTNSFPIRALNSFMEANKPILTSNNVVNADYMAADNHVLNFNFLTYFGQDRYGYTSALYNTINTKKVLASRAEAGVLGTYIEPRENNRTAIAYAQGSERGSAYIIPYGYTNTVLARTRENAQSYSFINSGCVNALTAANDPTQNATNTRVDRMNEGQISYYPYTINDVDGALVSKTQAQYFQLDLDSDFDKDGNSDIVVWYTLGNMTDGNGNVDSGAGIYAATPGDGINNYYIYNYGNVTFTGFGGKDEAHSTTEEKKLFVNTLIAAYEAGLINPTVSYYETADPNSNILSSIAVPYDQNVVPDSSVQLDKSGNDYLYKFVNPNTNPATVTDGTKVFFKVQDSNFVKGEKNCHVYFYLGVQNTSDGKYHWPDSTQVSDIVPLQLNDNSIVYVVKIPIVIYDADNFNRIGESNPANLSINPQLEIGKMYGFYAPMSYLNDRGAAEIYIQADTSYKVISSSTGQEVNRPLGTAYDMFTEIKQDLLKLD